MRNGREHARGVERGRERQLDQNAVDARVPVERLHPLEDFVFAGVRAQGVQFGIDARFLAGAHLVAHIEARRGIVADQHHRESGAQAEAHDGIARLRANARGERLAVNQSRRHRDFRAN